MTAPSPPRRVLFVCLGNIVRSPLAEALFRHYAQQRGLAQRYEADSAGTGGWHVGEGPDPRMVRVAARHGLHYDHRARQFHPRDFERFDLILVMDYDNWAHLMALAGGEPRYQRKIRFLREFDPQGGPRAEVPDPYYGGLEGFERVYAVIDRSVQGLLDALEQGRVPLDEAQSAAPGEAEA